MKRIFFLCLLLPFFGLSMAQKSYLLLQSEYHLTDTKVRMYEIVHFQRSISQSISFWGQSIFTPKFEWSYVCGGIGLGKKSKNLFSQTNIGLGYESNLNRPRIQCSQLFLYKNWTGYYSGGYGKSYYQAGFILYKIKPWLKVGCMTQTDGTTGLRTQFEFGPSKVFQPWVAVGYNFADQKTGASFGLRVAGTW